MSEHSWTFCNHCQEPMVRCGTCGNNCCNGGYGTLPNGNICPDCPEAYHLQALSDYEGVCGIIDEMHNSQGASY